MAIGFPFPLVEDRLRPPEGHRHIARLQALLEGGLTNMRSNVGRNGQSRVPRVVSQP